MHRLQTCVEWPSDQHRYDRVRRQPIDFEISARMSKAQAGETFTHAADRSIQFHGAIGFTYECHAQLYFRRAQGAEYRFGDAAYQRKKLADLIL